MPKNFTQTPELDVQEAQVPTPSPEPSELDQLRAELLAMKAQLALMPKVHVSTLEKPTSVGTSVTLKDGTIRSDH